MLTSVANVYHPPNQNWKEQNYQFWHEGGGAWEIKSLPWVPTNHATALYSEVLLLLFFPYAQGFPNIYLLLIHLKLLFNRNGKFYIYLLQNILLVYSCTLDLVW